MAPFATIYSYPNNFRVGRAQVVAAMNGLELKVDPDFKMGETNKTPEFLAKFPMGKVPAMETASGFSITEGAAIVFYLAGSGPLAPQLNGGGSLEALSRIVEWTNLAETELIAHWMQVGYMCMFKFLPFDQTHYDVSISRFERVLKRIELHLQKRGDAAKFLEGDKVTLADIMIGGALLGAAPMMLDAEMRKDIPAVVKYIEGLAAMPEFKAGFPELKFAEARWSKP